jgi:hypothetical protein
MVALILATARVVAVKMDAGVHLAKTLRAHWLRAFDFQENISLHSGIA